MCCRRWRCRRKDLSLNLLHDQQIPQRICPNRFRQLCGYRYVSSTPLFFFFSFIVWGDLRMETAINYHFLSCGGGCGVCFCARNIGELFGVESVPRDIYLLATRKRRINGIIFGSSKSQLGMSFHTTLKSFGSAQHSPTINRDYLFLHSIAVFLFSCDVVFQTTQCSMCWYFFSK